jgi:hypothetical protein
MSRIGLLVAAISVGLLGAVPAISQPPKPADPQPANKENIEAALRLTQACAAEYEFRVVGDEKEKPFELRREPVLRWSNPDRGEVHGNVFVWTRDGRPMAVGSLFKWFTPHTHMTHEFQSLAEGPLTAKFHGQQKWKTDEAGLKFADIPMAAAPAATEAQRLLKMKQLAKDFSGDKKEKEDANPTELRLLPKPVYQYAAPKHRVLSGGLFALVHGTDPEIWVLIEARGESAATARWQFAAARMNNVSMNLRYKGERVWGKEWMVSKDVDGHAHAYTKFYFPKVPDFLMDPPAKPKP